VGAELPSNGGASARTAPAPGHDSNGHRVRVLVVDDHQFFRRGLCEILAEQGLDVAGEVGSGEEAVELAGRLAPDVVVMDLRLPGISGIEASRRLAIATPQTRVLVLTISAAENDVTDAVLAGACGYLLKDASIESIVGGIRAAAAGESLISPRIATKLLDQIRSKGPGPDEPGADLTERELEILQLMAAGKDNPEIAEALFISPRTVKNHISNILRKLQIENRIQAAVYAVRKGII
jgi:DNA-binding NarL/FixJ family response regulator